MKFGNASWGFRELSLNQQLAITREMGLKYLELGIANAPKDIPLDVTGDVLRNVLAAYEKYGITLTHAATGNDFTSGDADLEKVKRVIDICANLGVEYLRIFSGFSPAEEVTGARWDTMINCLSKCAAYAKENNVTLTIETHGGVDAYDDGVVHFHSTSSHPESLYRMLNQLPVDVKINFDPANLYAVGMEHPEEVYEKIKDRVAVVHLKDFAKLLSGHIRPVACGEGGMDWKPILNALSDFHGVALFEYEIPEDIEEGSRRCQAFIMQNLR